ncbi:hypothetical protein KEM48_003456 [Puccinia striiformis f. sp. tritici PST-130]|nr:hypothetical protein KEM48_003456 [Puccinia striiformis f. sp. tritici PST-130]
MTARCSQFPIDSSRLATILTPHPLPSLARVGSSLICQRVSLTMSLRTGHPNPSHSPRTVLGLRSSCSSLASSTASSQSSGYFPPTGNLPFEETSSSGGGCGGPGGETLYPPLGGPGFSQAAAYPSYTGPSQRTSISGLGYPAAAFTPSGGSPPIASASTAYFHLDSAGAGRRHTVSSYASPIPIELNLVGHPEIDETLMKEEKRRRNKESSQRFRDRTRERLREKQERLEYLERRTKQLETQLRSPARSNSMQEGIGRDPSVGGGGRSEEREMIDRLQAENEALKSSLKTAAEEINRLQQLTGNQSPHSPLSIGQASSPAGDGSYFGPTVAHGSSPSSDTAAPANNNGQQRIGQPNPAFTSPNDPRVHQLTGFNPHHHHHPHHHQQQQQSLLRLHLTSSGITTTIIIKCQSAYGNCTVSPNQQISATPTGFSRPHHTAHNIHPTMAINEHPPPREELSTTRTKTMAQLSITMNY